MDGAAKASVHRCSRGEVGNTLAVVKLPTNRDHTASHILTALFTDKACVDAWGKSFYLQEEIYYNRNTNHTELPTTVLHK